MRKTNFRKSLACIKRCAALLAVFTAWPALSTAAEGLLPQHSEDLRPALARKGTAATLDFTAFGRDFRLQLAGNPRLAKLAAGSAVQLYQGTVEGLPGSWARISIQDGLPRGMIWDGRELFVVDAAPEAVNYGAAGTVIFKLSDAVLEQGVSLTGDEVDAPRDADVAYKAMVGELRDRAQALEAGVATERVDISVLGDGDYLARYANEAQARDALLIRLNNVDGIFSSQLGVELQIESVNLGGALSAALPATSDAGTLLEELGRLRQQTPALSATGLTHLITGRRLDGASAGIAYTLSLCSSRYAASLTTAHSDAALDTMIIAHEIGHVFGAPHDGAQQCAATPQGQYIMTPMLNSSITSFSQCSLEEINAVIESYSCVVPVPATAPAPEPPPPAPAPPAGDGGGGGGGSLDPSLLLLLLAFLAGRIHLALLPADKSATCVVRGKASS
jgi:hypothetical protein